MRVRYYVAASLDGFIATPEGGVQWLDLFSPEGVDFEAFMDEIAAVVMGRATLDVAMQLGPWAYGERPAVVLTHRPLAEGTPAVVEALSGTPADALAALSARGVTGDVWLLGGGQVAADFLAAGLLDTVEVAIMPIVLGVGIPLVGALEAHHVLDLVECKPLKSGMILTTYQVRR